MSRLQLLQAAGELSPLSGAFARFIARHCDVSDDSLLVLSAALLSERNQLGDVCVELSRYAEQLLFAATAEYEAVYAPDVASWERRLLASSCVGQAGAQTPMIIDDGRLYLQRFWLYECTVRRRCDRCHARVLRGHQKQAARRVPSPARRECDRPHWARWRSRRGCPERGHTDSSRWAEVSTPRSVREAKATQHLVTTDASG